MHCRLVRRKQQDGIFTDERCSVYIRSHTVTFRIRNQCGTHLETMSFCFHSVWIHLRLHSNWMDAAMAEAQIFFDSYHYPNWATGFISQGLVFTCMQCACTLRICSHWTFAKAKAAEQIANMWIGSLLIFLTLLSVLISRRGSQSVWMDLKTTILECERGRQLSRKPLRS